jgi:hypothetical protein
MQEGELVVAGSNIATIILHGAPGEVKVHFAHEAAIVPCDPQNADTLEYEVRKNLNVASGYVLLIKWNVSGVREIKFKVAY